MGRLTTLRPPVKTIKASRTRTLTTEVQRLGQSKWQRLRFSVFTRAKGLCECEACRASGNPLPAYEVDHIVPLWEGGSNDIANLQAISVECHRAKSDDEARRRGDGGGSEVYGPRP